MKKKWKDRKNKANCSFSNNRLWNAVWRKRRMATTTIINDKLLKLIDEVKILMKKKTSNNTHAHANGLKILERKTSDDGSSSNTDHVSKKYKVLLNHRLHHYTTPRSCVCVCGKKSIFLDLWLGAGGLHSGDWTGIEKMKDWHCDWKMATNLMH